MRTLRQLAWDVWRTPTTLLDLHVRPRHFEDEVRHVSGPVSIDCGVDDIVATCIVRNGELHLRSFIEHHFQLGVRHIVFLDNASTDQTPLIASTYDRVTVLHSALPYRTYEIVMKRYLARRFCANRWNLCVDIDERFDYPDSEPRRLGRLIAYLNHHRFTALVAQMLDMLPGEAARSGSGLPDEFPFYDLSNLRRTRYTWCRNPDDRVRMHWDGIRYSLFGTRNGLTKAALAFVSDSNTLFVDWHHAPNSIVADVTGVLLHYPFAGDFAAKVREAVAARRYSTPNEYRAYLKAIDAGVTIAPPPSAQRLTSLEDLVRQDFLVRSDRYREWMRTSA